MPLHSDEEIENLIGYSCSKCGRTGQKKRLVESCTFHASCQLLQPQQVPDVKLEQVDHPDHYGGEKNPYEVIKVLRAWLTREEFIGFLKGNIHKYLARAGKKSGVDGATDFAKATWYQNYLDKFVRGEE